MESRLWRDANHHSKCRTPTETRDALVSSRSQGVSSWETVPSSSRGHRDGLSAGRVAEPVVKARPATRQVVAAVRASAAVAEPDVVRRREAVRVRSVEARRPPSVHGACAAADVPDARAAIGDGGVLRSARGERVDRLADEGEVGVGVGDPVHHLLVGDEVRRGLY